MKTMLTNPVPSAAAGADSPPRTVVGRHSGASGGQSRPHRHFPATKPRRSNRSKTDQNQKHQTETMKTTRLSTLYSNLLLSALLAGAAGCKTSNYETANDTASGLQASADRIAAAQGQLDSTLDSLNDLVNSPTNLPAQYAKFSGAVNTLQSSAQDANARVKAMRAKGNDYFKEWDAQSAQIKNEDIKSRSEARKQEMQEKFTKVKLSYTQVSDAYRPFMSNLKDIQTALGTDLTPGGVTAVKGAAQKANEDAVPLKKSVDALAAELKELGAAMSAVAPPPAPATPPK
jgi:chromosome segregation ATPase